MKARRCPFCGYPAPHGFYESFGLRAVQCGSCMAMGPPGGSEAEAVKLWNRGEWQGSLHRLYLRLRYLITGRLQ